MIFHLRFSGVALVLTGLMMLVPCPPQASLEPPAQVGQPRDVGSELLQFTAAEHIVGFREEGIVAATGSHALRVDFLGANDVIPETDSETP